MLKRLFITSIYFLAIATSAFAGGKKNPTEDDYYRMVTFPLPSNVVLEVGGLEWLDDAKTRLIACTRRGEIWLIENPYAEMPTISSKEKASKNYVNYKRMLFGLHEPLGLLRHQGWIYLAQRAEVTRIKDTDGDDRIDIVQTFCNDWEISGSYHEYAFGPKLDGKGNMWVTLNRPFGGEREGKAQWRGWAVKIDKKGKMHPVCPGLRSPAGLGMNPAGDMFYTDNQGDWVAACKLSHLKSTTFQGNPLALPSCSHPLSKFKHPGNPPNGLIMPAAKKKYPILQLPAIWFPYPYMGRSHSDIIYDNTGDKFGPFKNQIFIGDQGQSIVVRCFLEKVGGEYQGACFPFRKGFQCGAMRMVWGKDGSMFVGQTNRGWGSSGGKPYGLQRLVWTGKIPFEIHEMRATPTGFHLTFTKAVDPKTAGNIKSYKMKCWTYRYHSAYGCKPIDTHPLEVTKVTVDDDGRGVAISVKGLAPAYVHELRIDGVRSADGLPPLHADAYYTLNQIPKE